MVFRKIYHRLRKQIVDCKYNVQKEFLTKFGNQYGGFYISEKCLEGKQKIICYSCGIGEDISFDEGLLEKYKEAVVYGFDPTPKSIKWVKENVNNDRFIFYSCGIGAFDGKTEFHFPKNPNYVSGSIIKTENVSEDSIEVDVCKVSTLMKKLGHDNIDILKMDIEGAEFDVISDILDEGLDIKQICIEIHTRFVANGREKEKKIIKQLKGKGYRLVYVSENREEFTFIKSN